jgi:hypothetical protein
MLRFEARGCAVYCLRCGARALRDGDDLVCTLCSRREAVPKPAREGHGHHVGTCDLCGAKGRTVCWEWYEDRLVWGCWQCAGAKAGRPKGLQSAEEVRG